MIAVIFLCIMKSHLFAMYRLQERVYRSRIRDVNHLMERLIERGVVRLGSQHHLCGSESVN